MDHRNCTICPACWKLVTLIILQGMLSAIIFSYLRVSMEPDPMIPHTGELQKQLQSSPAIAEEHAALTILLWTWPFGIPFPIESCATLLDIPACQFTANRSWYRKADAVIMHHYDVRPSRTRLPREPRPPLQRWIWFNMESPTTFPIPDFLDNLFNLTMSYRRDSDIFIPYGWLEVLAESQAVAVPPKSKLVAWVVSHWNPNFARVKYYAELKKYLQVDVYGRGHLPLPRNKHLSTLSQYKFYLAFENSIHEDYITEKVWRNALLSWAVPVVLGPPRKNYESFLPPESFIHVDDFPTAKELASFLQDLGRNTTRYESYFQWRSRLKPVGHTSWGFQYCRACQALQKRPTQYQAVPELRKWFT
ncbi:Galactoside 3(4)-L-fucosyltransferase [Varanus komodoensis]|nr:Galactoside 3(4)-L-fucosyltransferase [Varanus komodoensis]